MKFLLSEVLPAIGNDKDDLPLVCTTRGKLYFS